MDNRTLLLTVPDDDSAERVLRYVAKTLRDGNELIVLDYNPVIPSEALAPIVARLVTFIKIQEAQWIAKTNEALEGAIKA
jgi:hypothetical protein